jgi:hypothetical protein
LGLQITFIRNSIELLSEYFMVKIPEWVYINESHPRLGPINPNIELTQEESVLKVEEHHVNYAIIGSYIYLVTCTRADLEYPVSYL